MKSTYSLPCECTNCGLGAVDVVIVEIPIGKLVNEAICPNCGGQRLRRSGAVYVGTNVTNCQTTADKTKKGN